MLHQLCKNEIRITNALLPKFQKYTKFKSYSELADKFNNTIKFCADDLITFPLLLEKGVYT